MGQTRKGGFFLRRKKSPVSTTTVSNWNSSIPTPKHADTEEEAFERECAYLYQKMRLHTTDSKNTSFGSIDERFKYKKYQGVDLYNHLADKLLLILKRCKKKKHFYTRKRSLCANNYETVNLELKKYKLNDYVTGVPIQIFIENYDFINDPISKKGLYEAIKVSNPKTTSKTTMHSTTLNNYIAIPNYKDTILKKINENTQTIPYDESTLNKELHIVQYCIKQIDYRSKYGKRYGDTSRIPYTNHLFTFDELVTYFVTAYENSRLSFEEIKAQKSNSSSLRTSLSTYVRYPN